MLEVNTLSQLASNGFGTLSPGETLLRAEEDREMKIQIKMQSSFIRLINSETRITEWPSLVPRLFLSDLSVGNNITAAFSLLDTTERKGLSTCLGKIYSCSFPVEFYLKCLPFWYLLVCLPALYFFKPLKWASTAMGFLATFSHICIFSLCSPSSLSTELSLCLPPNPAPLLWFPSFPQRVPLLYSGHMYPIAFSFFSLL